MSEIIHPSDLTENLVKPYIVTRSKLGGTTKVFEDDFICSSKEITIIYDEIGEKLGSFKPTKAGFQYLVSFTDNTHYENTDLSSLEKRLSTSSKKTDKLILNWSIGHEYDGIENEMTITIRISNPMNPFVMLQAAMSKNHTDADNLQFESGSVSVSINGATQIIAEEIFAIVSRWTKACPQPKSITGLNGSICQHSNKITFMNFWVFPLLYIACTFIFLKNSPVELTQAYGVVFFTLFILIRSASHHFNNMIGQWGGSSKKFSLFSITGGDNNQQTELAAKSKNSSLKLFASVALSFVLNIAAGITVAIYY